MLNNQFLNKDPYVISTQETLIVLDIKSSVCMDNDDKDTKHNLRMTLIIHVLSFISENNNLVLRYCPRR